MNIIENTQSLQEILISINELPSNSEGGNGTRKVKITTVDGLDTIIDGEYPVGSVITFYHELYQYSDGITTNTPFLSESIAIPNCSSGFFEFNGETIYTGSELVQWRNLLIVPDWDVNINIELW